MISHHNFNNYTHETNSKYYQNQSTMKCNEQSTIITCQKLTKSINLHTFKHEIYESEKKCCCIPQKYISKCCEISFAYHLGFFKCTYKEIFVQYVLFCFALTMLTVIPPTLK